MAEHPIIDLTFESDDGDLAPTRASGGLTRAVPRPTEAAVNGDLENQRLMPTFDNMSSRTVSPTEPSSSRSDEHSRSLETAQGFSSHQGILSQTAEAGPGPSVKRQRGQGPEDSDDVVEGHRLKKTRTDFGASREHPIDILDADLPGDGARPRQQTEREQYCYFGSLPETPVCIDTKPRDDVELDVRFRQDSEEKQFVLVEIVQEAGRTRRSEKAVGKVTNSNERTFLLKFMRMGRARATVKRENTLAHPGEQHMNESGPGCTTESALTAGEEQPLYITARPGDRIVPGFTTTVTVEIYCEPGICGALIRSAKELQESSGSEKFWTTSPAVDHMVTSTGVTDKAGAGPKGQRQVSNQSSTGAASTEVSIVMQRAVNNLKPEYSIPETAAPQHITIPLHPHQKRALTFMKGKETGFLPQDASIQEVQGVDGHTCFQDVVSGHIASVRPSYQSGGVISDDMGMGKTLTIIAFILLMLPGAKAWAESKETTGTPRTMATLILVPSHLLDHWYAEILKRTTLTRDEVYVHHGSDRALPDLSTRKHVIVLTSLSLLAQKSAKDSKMFFGTFWHRVIFDEAHRLKSRKSLTFQEASKVPSKYKWAVTGTPIQNRINEIQSLFELSGIPHLSSPEGFKKYLVDPVQHNTADCGHRVKIILRTHVLRRKTDTTLFKARRVDELVKVRLSPAERELYNEAREKVAKELEGARSVHFAITRFHAMRKICSLGTSFRASANDIPAHVTEFRALRDNGAACEVCGSLPSIDDAKGGIVCMVMPCNHIICPACTSEIPVCPCGDGDGDAVGQAVLTRELDITDSHVPVPTAETMTEKMRLAVEAVENHPHAKVVILASYVDTVKVLSSLFAERGIEHACVHGDVPAKVRARGLKLFNDKKSNCRALIATMGTMGEGHSLSVSCRLICMDNEWNPKTMEQAYSRIYRIDQEQNVTITQFITEDTVDEKILGISGKKNKLADDFFDEWFPAPIDAKEVLNDIKKWCKN